MLLAPIADQLFSDFMVFPVFILDRPLADLGFDLKRSAFVPDIADLFQHPVLNSLRAFSGAFGKDIPVPFCKDVGNILVAVQSSVSYNNHPAELKIINIFFQGGPQGGLVDMVAGEQLVGDRQALVINE